MYFAPKRRVTMPVSHRFEKNPDLMFWTSMLGGSGAHKACTPPSGTSLHLGIPSKFCLLFSFLRFQIIFQLSAFQYYPVQLIPVSRKESIFLAVVGWEASCLKQSNFFFDPSIVGIQGMLLAGLRNGRGSLPGSI